jgi:hypothetical protein
MRIKSILSWLFFFGLVAVLLVGFSNLQAISDWLRLRDYQPSGRVVGLADDTTMKDGTRRVFYVNHPELDDKQEFNGHCKIAEATIVLGCFVENQGIYLLNVTDKRLGGVIEVTAAHEVLHAMYERLGSDERKKVDKMTADFFASLNDERIKQTVEGYRSRDPGVVPAELHSILGTEVRRLSPELENYYKRYFSDRQKIVNYLEKYEQAFVEIETKAKEYEARLDDLKQTINFNKNEIEARNQEINDMQKQLDALAAANRTEEYNRLVPVYNNLVAEYNNLVSGTKGAINEYNQLVDKLNQLVTRQQELYRAIDSNSINER